MTTHDRVGPADFVRERPGEAGKEPAEIAEKLRRDAGVSELPEPGYSQVVERCQQGDPADTHDLVHVDYLGRMVFNRLGEKLYVEGLLSRPSRLSDPELLRRRLSWSDRSPRVTVHRQSRTCGGCAPGRSSARPSVGRRGRERSRARARGSDRPPGSRLAHGLPGRLADNDWSGPGSARVRLLRLAGGKRKRIHSSRSPSRFQGQAPIASSTRPSASCSAILAIR